MIIQWRLGAVDARVMAPNVIERNRMLPACPFSTNPEELSLRISLPPGDLVTLSPEGSVLQQPHNNRVRPTDADNQPAMSELIETASSSEKPRLRVGYSIDSMIPAPDGSADH